MADGLLKGTGGADPFRIAKGLAQAESGKAPTGGPDMGPTLGEQIAKATQKQELAPLAQQEERADLKLKVREETQKARVDQGQRKLQQQALNMRQTFQQKASALMKSYQQNTDKLNLGRYKANVEQMGFYLRMGDARYVDKIKTEGNKARLQNKYEMGLALQQAVFSDERDLLSSNLQFKQLLSMDARQFQAELAKMDIQTAMQLAAAQANAQNAAALAQAVAKSTVDLASAYAAMKPKEPGGAG